MLHNYIPVRDGWWSLTFRGAHIVGLETISPITTATFSVTPNAAIITVTLSTSVTTASTTANSTIAIGD